MYDSNKRKINIYIIISYNEERGKHQNESKILKQLFKKTRQKKQEE